MTLRNCVIYLLNDHTIFISSVVCCSYRCKLCAAAAAVGRSYDDDDDDETSKKIMTKRKLYYSDHTFERKYRKVGDRDV